MDDKIKQLTEKILAEGVEKGKQEAADIVAKANNEREEALASAKKEAESIVATAQKKADELKRNVESELQLAASQTLQSLKSAIVDTLSARLSQLATGSITKEKEQLFSLVEKIVANWTPGEMVSIETAEANALSEYFKNSSKELFDKGLTIEEVAGKKSNSFTLKPSDGSYKINFGEDELNELFTSFLRPKLVELLFK